MLLRVLLQVLNLAGNKLRAIPSDVGWLGLKQLNISDNPDLNIPAHVLQCGFKYVQWVWCSTCRASSCAAVVEHACMHACCRWHCDR